MNASVGFSSIGVVAMSNSICLYDRGTVFGLRRRKGESILMSLPPLVRWEYDFRPEPAARKRGFPTFCPQDYLREMGCDEKIGLTAWILMRWCSVRRWARILAGGRRASSAGMAAESCVV